MQNKKHSLEFEKPLLDLEKQLEDLVRSSKDSDLDFTNEIKAIEKKIEQTKRVVYADLSPWQKVDRIPSCPDGKEYAMKKLVSGFSITGNKKEADGEESPEGMDPNDPFAGMSETQTNAIDRKLLDFL